MTNTAIAANFLIFMPFLLQPSATAEYKLKVARYSGNFKSIRDAPFTYEKYPAGKIDTDHRAA